MTANMSKVQSEAKEKDIDLRFVSFSVDPVNDDPKDLKEYGNNFNATLRIGFSNWDITKKKSKGFAANS